MSTKTSVILVLLFCKILIFSNVLADTFPPNYGMGAVDEINGPIHFSPVDWPTEASPSVVDCAFDCGGWKPYSRFQNDITDPRTQDPSNGGTRPQNYVNISSSCIDTSYPSIYYNLRKEPDTGICAADANECDTDVLMFRWRVEQIANTYATGPRPGGFGATDPWGSALWTVLFDIDGDGYRDVAAHLDGSSGSPSTEIDLIAGIWGSASTQTIDYLNDPDVKLIAHNPTSFIGADNSTILNFQDTLTPVTTWPNGSSETVWDYGTSRAKKVYTNSCTEYFIDYQIPARMLNASSSGPNNLLDGPKITRSSPLSMLFCTANSLNNPFQKDCALNKSWIADPNKPAPFGDYLSFNKESSYSQPLVVSVTAEAPLSCPGNYALSAKVQDTFAVVNDEVIPSIQSVGFYYWYDVNEDGIADNTDTGSQWTFIGTSLAPKSGTLNTWEFAWDGSSLLRGSYLIGVQAIDDKTLHDDGAPDSQVNNRTFSYIAGDDQVGTENYIYTNGWVWDGDSKTWIDDNLPGSWLGSQESLFPAHSVATIPDTTEDWFGNPDVTGVQIAQVGVDLAVNVCGISPEIIKSADKTTLTIGETVTFTLQISNPTANPDDITLTEIQDILPDGFIYDTASTTGIFGTSDPTISSSTLTWTGSVIITPGSSVSLVFTATAPNVTGAYSNSAKASTDVADIVSNTLDLGVGAPRLTITKTASSLNLSEGDPVTYNISYSNDSAINATNVVITDVIPNGLTFVSCTDGCSCSGSCAVGDTLTWSLADLASGEGPFTVSYSSTVTAPYPGTASIPLVNTAAIDSDQTMQATSSASSYIDVPRPELSLSKTSDLSLVAPAGDVTFTLAYENSGTVAATGVVLTDIIPEGFTFRSCSDSCTNPGVGVNGTVSWSLATISSLGSGSVTLTVRADDPFEALINPVTNSATLNSNETGIVQDSAEVGVSQTGQVCQQLYLRSDTTDVGVAGTKFIANSNIPSGPSSTVQTFADGNSTAGSPAGAVEIARFYQDPVSSQLITFDGSSTLSGSLDYIKSGVLGGTANANSVLYVTFYDYDPATGTEVQIAQVSQTDNGSPSPPVLLTDVVGSGTLPLGHRLLIVMAADVAMNKATTIELETDSVASFVEVCAAPPVNLVLEKSVDASSIASSGTGRTLTYDINYANASSITGATGVILTDVLPATGITFSSCSVTGSTHFLGCTHNMGTVTFHDGAMGSVPIAAGGTGNVTITVAVDDDLSGESSIDNTSSILSDQTTVKNALASTIVQGAVISGGTPQISLIKKADDTSVIPGQTVVYTLTALNAGTEKATNVVITDDFPEQSYYAYGSCTPALGTCMESPSGSLLWNLGTLNAGDSAILTYSMVAKVTPAPPLGLTELTNSAIASDDTYCTGSLPASCTSETEIVTISTNPDLSISKVVSAGPYSAGDTLTYTLTVSNSGTTSANEVNVYDAIPSLTNYVADSLVVDMVGQTDVIDGDNAAFESINNAVTFNLGSLLPMTTKVLSFQVKVLNVLPNGSNNIDNTAIVKASNASTKQDVANINVQAEPLMSINKSGASSLPFPAATLALGALSGDTTISVVDSSHLSVGQYIKIGGDIFVIIAVSGNNVSLDSFLTLDVNIGDDVLSSFTYSLTYQNTGEADSQNVSVNDNLPANFLYVASNPVADVKPSQGNTGSVSWNVGAVDVGNAGVLQVTVIPDMAGSYTNIATLSDDDYCTGGSPPVECSNDHLTNVGGLLVSKVTDTPLVAASTGIPLNIAEYTITVSNSTGSSINDVDVTDKLSKGFTYKANTTTGADEPVLLNGDASTPVWSVDVPADSFISFTFEVEIAEEVGAATYQNDVSLGNVAATIGVTPFDALSTIVEDVTIIGADNGIVDGYVFEDNGDMPGSFDVNDLRYANVPVVLSRNGATCWVLNVMNAYSSDCYVTYTDQSGYFSLILPVGNWTVEIIDGEGDLPMGESLVVGTNTTDIDVISQTVTRDLNGFSADAVIPSLTINDVTINEDAGTATFTVTASSTVSGSPATFSYTSSDGSAMAGSDYSSVSGTGTIAVGDMTTTITVPITNDVIDEANEIFTVSLSSPANATIADGTGIATIIDNDGIIMPISSLIINDVTVNEDAGTATFIVTASSTISGSDVTFSYTSSDGSANAGSDYTSVSGTGTIVVGAMTTTITVPITNDVIDEANEIYTVSLSSPANATIADGTGIGTIVDNDGMVMPSPSLIINDVTINEDAGTATFIVTASSTISGSPATFNYTSSDGSAMAGTDYTSVSGTGTIAIGDMTTTITVPITNDVIDEANEVYTVSLSSPANASIADGTGVGTIIDNDGIPSLIINDVTINEDAGTATFIVTASSTISGSPATFNYTSSDGSAMAGSDYTSVSGTGTIAVGAMTTTITVPITNDVIAEANEVYTLSLSSPANASIADGTGIGTIIDNDGMVMPIPSLIINDVTINEDAGTATFIVTASSTISGSPATFSYTSSDGSAMAGSDYTSVSGTGTIAVGDMTTAITVPIANDVIAEANEVYTVSLSSPANATIADGTGIGTIIDNDGFVMPNPSLTINDVTINEDAGTATFTVTASSTVSGSPATFSYTSSDGSAMAGSDYTSVSSTGTIAVGDMTTTITVPITNDVIAEANEIFTVSLSSPANASIADGTGIGTIIDNDGFIMPIPSLIINDVTINEDAGTATFIVTSSSMISGSSATFSYTSSDGSAMAASDYTSVSGIGTIVTGAMTTTITVPIMNDVIAEANEIFTVSLSSPANASIADGTGIGTIIDDDGIVIPIPLLNTRALMLLSFLIMLTGLFYRKKFIHKFRMLL